FCRTACSLWTHCENATSGLPFSATVDACWAMPRQTGSRLRLGISCESAGAAAAARTAAVAIVIRMRIKLIAKSYRQFSAPSHWAQLERRQAEHNIKCDRPLQRQWVEGDCAARASHQHMGAGAEPDAEIAGRADIFAGKRTRRQTFRRRKHAPAQDAAGAHADIDAHGIDRAVVILRRRRGEARRIGAFHRLMA